ncbi:hypothetical protein BCV71DRAFT_239281 [Rhizopus microsporus]|uniref:Uncharacterized protein n=1 Tax=Rhizopus microsporus TaxID=58291 RepID=A0A1X0RN16_RHIZD|nr:hypothetical protein BCV71DRAFT_239281 [Rhizopus microsporus]
MRGRNVQRRITFPLLSTVRGNIIVGKKFFLLLLFLWGNSESGYRKAAEFGYRGTFSTYNDPKLDWVPYILKEYLKDVFSNKLLCYTNWTLRLHKETGIEITAIILIVCYVPLSTVHVSFFYRTGDSEQSFLNDVLQKYGIIYSISLSCTNIEETELDMHKKDVSNKNGARVALPILNDIT